MESHVNEFHTHFLKQQKTLYILYYCPLIESAISFFLYQNKGQMISICILLTAHYWLFLITPTYSLWVATSMLNSSKLFNLSSDVSCFHDPSGHSHRQWAWLAAARPHAVTVVAVVTAAFLKPQPIENPALQICPGVQSEFVMPALVLFHSEVLIFWCYSPQNNVCIEGMPLIRKCVYCVVHHDLHMSFLTEYSSFGMHPYVWSI